VRVRAVATHAETVLENVKDDLLDSVRQLAFLFTRDVLAEIASNAPDSEAVTFVTGNAMMPGDAQLP
jgi:hypothetical protein